MQARLIAYPPGDAALVRLIGPGEVLLVGRGAGMGLWIEHPSVSRSHARLEGTADHVHLRDLGSKNGSFVDGVRCDDQRLPASCWLRFGDVYGELEAISSAELARSQEALQRRRLAATAHTTRIQRLSRLDDLLKATLEAVLEIAGCERGFALLAPPGRGAGQLEIRASVSLAPGALLGRGFSGSIGAVQRALGQRRVVVSNDVAGTGWLGRRDSVVQGRIRALACIPLLDGDQVLGALYVDRTSPGAALSTLDVELLQAFTENAATWIAARRASALLEGHAGAGPDWNPVLASHAVPALDDA